MLQSKKPQKGEIIQNSPPTNDLESSDSVSTLLSHRGCAGEAAQLRVSCHSQNRTKSKLQDNLESSVSCSCPAVAEQVIDVAACAGTNGISSSKIDIHRTTSSMVETD